MFLRPLAALAAVLVPAVACEKRADVVSADPVVKASASTSASVSVSVAPPRVAPSYAALGEPALECPVLGFGALGSTFGGAPPSAGDAGPRDGGPGEGIGLGALGWGGHVRQKGVTGHVVKAGAGLVAQHAGAVICTALPLVRACYDEARKGRPTPLAGSLELELQLSDKGKVDKVLVLPGSTLTEPALVTCVTEAVEKLTFSTTTATKLEYHFGFDPAPRVVKVSDKGVTAKGELPREVVQRIVRAHFGRFRACYDTALRKDPTLTGKTVVEFEIDDAGAVVSSKIDPVATTIGDPMMQACVLGLYKGVSFPKPTTGTVSVRHTLEYAPE